MALKITKHQSPVVGWMPPPAQDPIHGLGHLQRWGTALLSTPRRPPKQSHTSITHIYTTPRPTLFDEAHFLLAAGK